MEPARWNRIEELLQAALDLEPGKRTAFLDDACGGEEDLRREVDALLSRESEGALLSESPVIGYLGRSPVPLTGQKISHYHIERRIGAGGMGEVYQARDESLQRTVALKTLPMEFTGEAERVRRFEQEAFAASRLNHPNIITIFEILHADGAHLIATEHIEGQTLREMLTDPQTSKPRKLSVEKALDIAIQVAAALKAAHTAWIIHRDVKPENIMVRSDGLVKVLDFGIAKLSEELSGPPVAKASSSAAPNLTVPGAVLGTANYMSPEQARGEPLDGRTDLFSLGLVLHEMVTGERPSAKSKLDQVPKELQRIIRKMLRPDRDERYASAAELLDDLHRFKRRLESRTARRMVGVSGLTVVVAVMLTAIAALFSVNEVWEERVLRDGHTAAARQAVFSPDGRLLVSCGEDRQVIVWDFARRERLATLKHSAYKVAFSPDGRWFATGGTEGTLIIWDAKSWEKNRVLREHRAEIGALNFSPDATLLAASDAKGSTVLWDTSRWEKVRVLPFGVAYGTLLFSPNLRQILFSAGLTVYDLTREEPPSNDPRAGANWIALSPDAVRLAAVDPGGNVSFYRFAKRGNLNQHELIARRRAHQDHGRSVAFSPDGRLVASAAEDAVLWDVATQKKIARFEHSAIVWSVVFSPDGRWLVSTHGDGAVLVWNVAERERVANLNEHSGAVRAVAFAPDGRRVASAGEDRSVTLWDLELGRKQAVLAEHQTRVNAVSFSRDASHFASVDQDGLVVLWDVAKRQPRLRIRPPELFGGYTYCLAISPDGRSLATSYGVYATGNGHNVVDFYAKWKGWRFGQVYGAAFTADGRRLACVTDAGWVLLLDIESGRLLGMQHVPNTHQISVSLSADGKWLVTGEDEGAVRLWSVTPLRQVAVLGRHAARVKSVAFSPDGASVASAGDDKMIALWDVKRRKLRGRVGTHASPVYSVAFSADGRRLVSGEHDRSVRVYTRQRTLWGFRLE